MDARDRRARRPLRRDRRQHDRRDATRAHHPSRPAARRRAPATSSRSANLRRHERHADQAAARLPRPARRRHARPTIARACGAPCAAAIVARAAGLRGHLPDARQANGVDPASLILAWDFTTASSAGADRLDRLGPRPGVRARHAVVHRDERRRRPGGAGRNANICRRDHGHVPGAALHDRRRARPRA